MKTNKSIAGLLVILSFSVVMVSCGKSDLTGSNTDSSTNTTGGIMDLGVIEGNVRGMHVSLTNVEINLTDKPNKSAAERNNRLNIYMQTESDGIIRDGIYYYSATSISSPYIFKTALVDMQNSVTGNSDTFFVSGGSVVVARTGSYYTFNLSGTLFNGNTIRASFSGLLSYSD